MKKIVQLLKDYEQYRNDLTVESWKKFWQEQFDKSLPITVVFRLRPLIEVSVSLSPSPRAGS